MLSDMPSTYTAADFVRVHAYEPEVQRAIRDWYYERNIGQNDPVEILLTKQTITYTLTVLSTFISTRETIDLVKIESTVPDDVPARFIVSSAGFSRIWSAGNHSKIETLQETRVSNEGDNVVMYKSRSGEFLYFNLGLLGEV
ncbi:hypothetical protein PP939_gp221 [Rhizobium phage RL38J1]|uniref:Uncharacterized protein n=1 Tax=Rhizobium phage RL38J1 TaxID=2663232 RepID=A0A6B9J372_9CAUD|nr:hypothetical protein PP939_gp221 [Rhizobium phage RL38J1]QGZ13938.1 hypothetical protein RL38J1_221 [Rhizobium phage RL38J1]